MENVNLNAKKPFALSAFFATAINTIILFVFASRAEYFYMAFTGISGKKYSGFFKAGGDKYFEKNSFLYCELHGNNIKILPYFSAVFSTIALLLIFAAVINLFRLNEEKCRAVLVLSCVFNIISLITYIASFVIAIHSMKLSVTDNEYAFNLLGIGAISSVLSVSVNAAVIKSKKYQMFYGNIKAPLVFPVFMSFLCATLLSVYSLRAGYYFLYEKLVKNINMEPAATMLHSDKGKVAMSVYDYKDLITVIHPMAYISAFIALAGFVVIVFAMAKTDCMTKKSKMMTCAYFILNICSLVMLITGRLSAMSALRRENKNPEAVLSHSFGYSDICVTACILNVAAGVFAFAYVLKETKRIKINC